MAVHGRVYIWHRPGPYPDRAMSDHQFEGHFPEEAEQNEIGGPVLFALMILGMIVLLIWAAS
jgi:hypothetical protein